MHAPAASHVSAPLHALPSLHDVPAATGVCETPVAASQASAVQGLPSSTVTCVPLVQVPAWQVSDCVHALPSLQVVPFVFAGFEQAPVAESQVPAVWHWSEATHVTGVPGVHEPLALHVSAPLHTLASLHDVPAATGVWVTPLDALHASVVHGLPSSTVGGVPAVHAAEALHVSAPLQALPSPHEVPAATGV
jgi:hypothetical protein